MNERLDSTWKTKQLQFRDMLKEDIPDLQNCLLLLFNQSDWGEVSLEVYDQKYFEQLIESPSLPPEGHRYQVQNQTLLTQAGSRIIGWYELYHGYPSVDTAWIGSFFIRPDFQGKGFGEEIISGLLNKLEKDVKYHAAQLAVYSRNWKALRFWHQMGFDRIARLSGDSDFGADKNLKICLENRF